MGPRSVPFHRWGWGETTWKNKPGPKPHGVIQGCSHTCSISNEISQRMRALSLGTLGSGHGNSTQSPPGQLLTVTHLLPWEKPVSGTGTRSFPASSSHTHKLTELPEQYQDWKEGCNPYTHQDFDKSWPVDELIAQLLKTSLGTGHSFSWREQVGQLSSPCFWWGPLGGLYQTFILF